MTATFLKVTASYFPALFHGESPRYVLNSFLHDWWCHAIERRQELIRLAPRLEILRSSNTGQLFVPPLLRSFASGLFSHILIGSGSKNICLPQPWILSPAEPHEVLTPFARRNIIVSRTILENKYEFRDMYERRPRWSIFSDQELARFKRTDKRSSSSNI
jgi:hypothetical protein